MVSYQDSGDNERSVAERVRDVGPSSLGNFCDVQTVGRVPRANLKRNKVHQHLPCVPSVLSGSCWPGKRELASCIAGNRSRVGIPIPFHLNRRFTLALLLQGTPAARVQLATLVLPSERCRCTEEGPRWLELGAEGTIQIGTT